MQYARLCPRDGKPMTIMYDNTADPMCIACTLIKADADASMVAKRYSEQHHEWCAKFVSAAFADRMSESTRAALPPHLKRKLDRVV